MYTIYHIPGIKVGCSKRVEARIKEQGYTEYEILETCNTIQQASEREAYWQEKLKYIKDYSTYKNTIRSGFFARTPEAKAKFKETIKLSEAWKEVHKVDNLKFLSLENKEKSLKARCNSKLFQEHVRKLHTPEIRAKVRESLKVSEKWKRHIESKKKPISQFNAEGILIRDWSCAFEASKQLKISNSGIVSCLKERRKLAHGFIWKYKNN